MNGYGQRMWISPCVLALAALVQTCTGQAVRGEEPSQTDSRAWFPLQPARDDFAPSILDCSRWIDAPTGKHGFVTVAGDRFVFEDGTPARFWGAQMNVFDRQQLDYAIRRMRRQGINMTRLHGLEFLGRRDAETSLDYRSDAFERLDYLIQKLGENGIYIIST